jgi:hypothetical protein
LDSKLTFKNSHSLYPIIHIFPSKAFKELLLGFSVSVM